MTWRGEGTAADGPLGWAWLALAAERGYPQMVAARDSAWDALDEDGRSAAVGHLQRLAPEYADRGVEPRASRLLAAARRFERMATHDIIRGPDGRWYMGLELYNPRRFQFWNLVQYETETMLDLPVGRVELRELRLVDD